MSQNQDVGFTVAILSLVCEAKDETQQAVDDREEHSATLLPAAGQNANRKFLHLTRNRSSPPATSSSVVDWGE
jgi:hypothetical protein